MPSRKLQSATAAGVGAIGQLVYVGDHVESTSPLYTDYSWVVPAGVSTISAVCVGAGTVGTRSESDADGGKSGSLRYATSLAVTPGETLTIRVPDGSSQSGASGYGAAILRGSTALLRASDIETPTPIGGNIGGGDGVGAASSATSTYASGGGGAAGYSGDGGYGEGGNGADSPPAANSGAAYGGDRSTGDADNGGGVGLMGPGPTGSQYYDISSDLRTVVGSYGFWAPTRENRNWGFGSGGGGSDSTSIPSGPSGPGAVRIIWGGGRSYPNDVDNYLPYTGENYSEIEVRMYSASGVFYLNLISLKDASDTNILASLTGVAGDSTSTFSSLSAGQFTIRSNTSITAANVGAIKGTSRTGSTTASTASTQPYEYISLLIKPSSAKTIKSFTFNGTGNSTASIFSPLYAVEIIADGVNLTNGMACLRGDYTTATDLVQTITFT